MAHAANELRVSFVASDTKVVITIAGEIDIAVSDRLRAQLDRVLESRDSPAPRRVVLDVAQVEFLDAAGVRPILECRARLAEHGCTLCLRRPQPRVRRTLDLLGLTELIEP